MSAKDAAAAVDQEREARKSLHDFIDAELDLAMKEGHTANMIIEITLVNGRVGQSRRKVHDLLLYRNTEVMNQK